MVSSCDHGNESLGSIKGEELLKKLSEYYLLKKDSVLWIVESWRSNGTIRKDVSTVRPEFVPLGDKK
jgi:hypothetical protein